MISITVEYICAYLQPQYLGLFICKQVTLFDKILIMCTTY